MKKTVIFFIFLSIFIIGCGDDGDKGENGACDPTCDPWESCIDGDCVLKEGNCNSEAQCQEGDICDLETHQCKTEGAQCSFTCNYGVCNPELDICELNETAIDQFPITTGLYPNDILHHNNTLYIVNSGDNAIQKIELTDGPTETNPFISLDDGTNPYYGAIYDNIFFVTGLFNNSISYAPLDNPEDVTTLIFEGDQSFISPEGIAVNDNYIVVTSINPNWATGINNEGKVHIIDRETDQIVKILTTTQLNPQKAFIDGDNLYILNSGAVYYDENSNTFPASDWGIDYYNLSTMGDTMDNNIVVPFIDGDRSGYPGSLTLTDDKQFLYLASGSAPEIYKLDFSGDLFNSSVETIDIDDQIDGNCMLTIKGLGGDIFVTNFNNDTLYIVDVESNKVKSKIDIGSDPDLMEGAQGIVYNERDNYLYIFFGISRKIVTINLNSL